MSWIVECRGRSDLKLALVVGRLFLGELVALERLFGCRVGLARPCRILWRLINSSSKSSSPWASRRLTVPTAAR